MNGVDKDGRALGRVMGITAGAPVHHFGDGQGDDRPMRPCTPFSQWPSGINKPGSNNG